MTDREMELVARGMAPVIREAVAAATEPLLARIAALEQRAPVPGRDGRDGTSVSIADVSVVIAAQVEKAVSALPRAKDGVDGKDGRDAVLPDVDAIVQAAVVKAVEALPVPKDGASVTVDDVAPLLESLVAQAVSQIPVPKDGRDGIDGKDGRDGQDADPEVIRDAVAAAVSALPAPKDGKDGRDGIDGKDGADGRHGVDFSVKDLVSHDFEGRTLTLRFARDGVTYDAPIYLSGLPIYREVFKDGVSYRSGDLVTWGGGMWIARADTMEKPGAGATAWRLCVKAGRDGKQGPAGPEGKPGPRGEKGERGPAQW